jgi:hypothetical protein
MIHIDVERAQARDFDRFCRTVTTVGEGQLVCQAASTSPWNGIPHEGASWQIPSNPVGDTMLILFRHPVYPQLPGSVEFVRKAL